MRRSFASWTERPLHQLAACATASVVCLGAVAGRGAAAAPAESAPANIAAPPGGLAAVTGDSGTVVSVDGIRLGTLPLGEPLRLPVGRHRLAAALGTHRIETVLTIEAERPLLVRLSFSPPLALTLRPKIVAVCAGGPLPPPAEGVVKAAILAEQALPILSMQAPSSGPPAVTANCDEQRWHKVGRAAGADYVLLLAPAGSSPAIRVYDVATGTQAAEGESSDLVEPGAGLRESVRRVLALALDRPHGTLAVVSSPAGARIQLDGTARGVTPWSSLVHSGPHRVLAQLAGYLPAAGEAQVQRDQSVRLVLTLSPRPVPQLVRRTRGVRWALLGLGLGAAALGGTLWALDGRPFCDDPQAAALGRCPQELATQSAGIALVAGAAASLAVSAGLVAVEKRLLRRELGKESPGGE